MSWADKAGTAGGCSNSEMAVCLSAYRNVWPVSVQHDKKLYCHGFLKAIASIYGARAIDVAQSPRIWRGHTDVVFEKASLAGFLVA